MLALCVELVYGKVSLSNSKAIFVELVYGTSNTEAILVELVYVKVR